MAPNPLVIPAGFGEATLIWTQDGDPDPYSCSFGFTDDGATTANNTAEAIRIAWVTEFSGAGTMGTGYVFRGVDVRIHRGAATLQGEAYVNTVGTYVNFPAPQNVALLVKKNTGLAGRGNRGRMFLPPAYVGEGGIGPTGIILQATLDTLNGTLEDFRQELIAQGFDMVLLHSEFVRDPSDPPPAKTMIANPNTTPATVTSLQMQSVVATQRRRLR